MYAVSSVLSPGSPRTDTLIIVLSETKEGNGLHECVSFHVCDLLPDYWTGEWETDKDPGQLG